MSAYFITYISILRTMEWGCRSLQINPVCTEDTVQYVERRQTVHSTVTYRVFVGCGECKYGVAYSLKCSSFSFFHCATIFDLLCNKFKLTIDT